MNQELARVLLVEPSETTARFLRDCCARISSYRLEFDWVTTREAALDALLCVPYDAYLLDLQFVLGKDGDLLPAILELGRFAPAIALVDGVESGRAALELGAADFLETEKLDPMELERSLRLTLRASRSERQLACDHRDRQLAEETWQENEWAFQINEERLHGILESLDDVVLSFNPQSHKLLYLNAAVESVYGYTVSEFFQDLDLWRARIHPDDRDRVEQCVPVRGSLRDRERKGDPATTDGFDIDYRIFRRDGTLRWLRERTRVIYDRTGLAIRCNSIVSDITAHKQAQERLQQQMERERLLAQLARDIRSSLNLDEILNTTVREVQKLLGCDRAAIVRLAAPESGTISHEARADGIESLSKVQLADLQFLHAPARNDSQASAASVSQEYIEDTVPNLPPALQKIGVKSQLVLPILQQKALWGLLVVHQCREQRDWQGWEVELLQQLATQVAIALYQAQLLEEQTRYARELARSNQELEQFAYIASHDLQEPLRAAIGFAQLLEQEYRDVLGAEGREYVDFIVEGAMRMRQLIQDLLALSRVGTRGKQFALTDCGYALEQALDNLKVAIAESNALVTYDPLPTIVADECQLIQLFQNTIANAIKFRSERQPRIHIRAESEPADSVSRSHFRGDLKGPKRRGSLGNQAPPSSETQSVTSPAPIFEETSRGRSAEVPSSIKRRPANTGNSTAWLFSVRDNGIGIEEKYRDRIFEIFQRLHTREQYEGTGIGLAICQKIVQRHEGRIWVESIPGEGSVFYFTLMSGEAPAEDIPKGGTSRQNP
ncbi:ATP-binding protein [Oscillatoria sp. FACHB-1406]|uniref:ATP-binding protein n=1 Tax=Oscillatoria sp. FACHB-1406 TaxID=2692846 RepID=UPI0016898A8C|nr:ATP-binding protein [Oscillatoria sp. FACHB-1406]MBD2576098.1 GAF domain-containing protein [Oscillatoria sp. FACHB-1406]